MVTFENGKNYWIQFEMQNHYLHSTTSMGSSVRHVRRCCCCT